MALPDAAATYWRRQQQINASATALAGRAWDLTNGDAARWESTLETVVAAISRAQARATLLAGDYVSDSLTELDIDAEPLARVTPAPLIGRTGSGVPLINVYSGLPEQHRLRLLNNPDATGAAMTATRKQLEASVQTVISDAGRAAESLHITTRRGVGYVRMLVPPSCSRCVIQAGKYFRWNAGFKRHPKCFPAGTVVSGPKLDAATRRWFDGELVILSTASGEELAVTGNHPILTRRGWVPANLLKEGDEVVRSTRSQGAAALVVPDHNQVPARIENVWNAFAVGGSRTVESSPEDFHGDGQHGQVDVVSADGSLWNWSVPMLIEHLGEEVFSAGLMLPLGLNSEGAAALVDKRGAALAGRAVRGGSLGFPFAGGHSFGADLASLAVASNVDASSPQSLSDYLAGYAVLASEGIFTSAGNVCSHDVGVGKLSLPRWDAPSTPMVMEGGAGYADRGQDLLHRLAGQVELDRVVVLRRVDWSGHVYSLTSSEGWHTANSLIVSNCDCRHVPASESVAGDLRVDPKKYFRRLNIEQQDGAFGKAGAQAIRDGASITQVVNADSGMREAQVYGRNLAITDQGVTRFGYAGQVFQARGRRAYSTPRLMPSSIYQIAESREDAVRLLRLNGYITPEDAGVSSIEELLSI